ncbi:hypothetical protein [uncultured Cohaesibacter sp.]|uniref:hypothetical protein n=1 Tax=uncultured Cohaesibacter sp. TaxID=1002546 RepID=UPI0029C95EBA|nr:hypothetical protein [uncultured Cohaesibacter sp.]
MSSRLDRMRILLRAQEQMQQSAQRAVDQVSRELDLLRKRELVLLTLMAEGDTVMVNTLMNSHVHQIRQVSQRKSDMQNALETLRAETRKQALFMESVKRMVKMLEENEQREAEKREQMDIIERTAYQSEVI